MSLDNCLSLTVPQLHILEENLSKICQVESGEDKKKNVAPMNTKAAGETIKMLREKTGRNEFTYQELLNPADTIAKYKRV